MSSAQLRQGMILPPSLMGGVARGGSDDDLLYPASWSSGWIPAITANIKMTITEMI